MIQCATLAVVPQPIGVVLGIGSQRSRPAQGDVTLTAVVPATPGIVRIQPLAVAVGHARLPVATNLYCVRLGPDEISPTHDEVTVDVHFVPSLSVAAANTILVGKSQCVRSSTHALLHCLCLVRSNIPTASQLRNSIAR